MRTLLVKYRKLTTAVIFSLFSTAISAQVAEVQVSRNPIDNTVKSVVFSGNTRPEAGMTDEILQRYMELDNAHELKLKFSNKQKNGMSISRYTQWYQNIQVEHGSVSVVAVQGAIGFINANIFKPAMPLSTQPFLSEAQALKLAVADIRAEEYMWENVTNSRLTEKSSSSFKSPVANLVWVEDFSKAEPDKQLHLAYRFDIYAKKPVSRDLIYIDATTGSVLLKDPVIKHVGATGASVYSGIVGFNAAHTGSNKYEMYDSTRLVETYDVGGGTSLGFAILVNSASATFGKSVGVDAHWGATTVYDYWLNEQGRSSYDGFGTELSSVVNYDIAYNNAFWNGYAMIYGSGTGMFNGGFDPLVVLDVCAHEIGHGVCQTTSSLVYSKESGAMNEGFSDIWGAVIEHYGAPGKQMWTIGEEIKVGALRSMRNPKLYDNPDTYTGLHWTNIPGCSPNNGNDQCGVHNNSGVLNHWFYLLTEGGKGTNDLSNAFEVAGIGIKKAADLAYATEQVLSSTATYADCRSASINIAMTQYGTCSREVEAVTRAWYAVGVGAAFVPCAPQIGFGRADTTIDKAVPGVICPSSTTISIPVQVTGNAPTGGNATVTVSGTGSAVANADYKILNSPLTFNSGNTATQMLQVSIMDNGDVAKDKVVKLYFSITQNGSNATTSFTYDTCTITITGARNQPDTAGNLHSQLNIPDVKSKAISPFFSRNKMARTQFIITDEELTAAGVRPNTPIADIAFNVTEKNSVQAFANFNLKIGATTVKNVGGGNPTVTTVYYNNSLSTQTGWNTIPLSTPLVWNGTDNLAFETCFTNNTTSTENDYIEGIVTTDPATSVTYSDIGTSGCSLLFTSGSYYYSISKPVIRLVQPTYAAQVEKQVSGSKPWEVNPGQKVFFQNDADGKLIACLENVPLSLGCTNIAITAQGVGLDTIVGTKYKGVKRSLKEFYVISQNNTSATFRDYEMTLYFDTSELPGVNLANARIVTTKVTTDAAMNGENTEIVVPVIIQGANYIAFKGSFHGNSKDSWKGIWGRYFITDDTFTLLPWESVANISKNSGNIRVVNNPFTDKIYINYHLTSDTKAQIKLYDITGKVVMSNESNLRANEHSLDISPGDQLLAPGNYVLQIVTDTEVLTQKMVKQ